MNPKGCNPLLVSLDITAAVVWLETSVSIISLGWIKVSKQWCFEQLFLEFVKCSLMFVFPFPLLILLCQLC